jgi:hypothetical protein
MFASESGTADLRRFRQEMSLVDLFGLWVFGNEGKETLTF